MEKLPLIELAELNKSIIFRDSFQDIFSIADLDGGMDIGDPDSPERFAPMRLNALLMVLTFEGTLEIHLDYVSYIVKPNSFITIMPTHALQLDRIGKDFKGRLLIASKEFLNDCNPGGGNRQVIREKMRERTHFYQKELVQNAFIGFLLDLGNIMLSKKDRLIRPTLSRKEELFEQFLQLLFEHCKEQHVVTFYAERLFITPQYLSLILKELTGKSANKWIDDALIVEAKILLKAPQATVQQVADILHFSDQSTFGKFFKKHMGISPMEYRKS